VITHAETGSDTATLVRETIQNALDARVGDQNPVVIRFKLSDKHDMIPSAELQRILATLEEHLKASSSDLPDLTAPAPYLVIEDFNTSGLDGDPVLKDEGGFACFFRKVGYSQKTGKDIGRHGLGKAVFMKVSQIKTYFGLTIRKSDERRLLMGQSPQTDHKCGTKPYKPYGLFGLCYETGNEDCLVRPVEDDEYCAYFSELFDLERKNQPGLSIVVLYPEEDVTADDLIKAIIKEYFFAIIKGDLVANVQKGRSDPVRIDNENIKKIIEGMGDEDFKEDCLSVPDFVTCALGRDDSDFYRLAEPRDQTSPKWSTDLFSGQDLEDIRIRYDGGERLAFEVPVTIREKTGRKEPEIGWFKVFLQKIDPQKKGFSIFIREGIKITMETKKTKGIRGLVLVDSPSPLATSPVSSMLGNAENIAHTAWDKDQPGFKDRYFYGPGTLSFVKGCLSAIQSILRRPAAGLEKNAFPWLAVPDSIDAEREPVPEKELADDKSGGVPEKARIRRRGGWVAPPRGVPLSRPAPVRVDRIEKGFSISKGSPNSAVPRKIHLKVAYATRAGNPFSKYQKADFDVSDPASGIVITGENYKLGHCKQNTIEFEVTGDPFVVYVTGFDGNRDLAVDVKSKGG
jgi:hypothetical protein